MLLPNIYLYSLLLMKLHPFPLLLLYFALYFSVPEIVLFFKKRVYLIVFFCFFLLRNQEILEQVETIIL